MGKNFIEFSTLNGRVSISGPSISSIIFVVKNKTISMAGILHLVSTTPLVELKKIPVHPNLQLHGKLAGNNPGGSVKDRAAYAMIQAALDRGEIRDGLKLIEAPRGHTGIALPMIA